MSSLHFPHSRIHLSTAKTVVISGPHFQVLSTATGAILFSTTSLKGDDRNNLLKSGHIRCSAIDSAAAHFAISGDDKKLKVWSIADYTLLSARDLPKKPTDIQFTKDGQTILVSDKFGDVFSYPLHPAPEAEKNKKEGPVSHENPSDGKLVLGHASVVTSFALSHDERYIMTGDRDEHVRVSWYPQGYNVERYCLGHEKYISSLHIPKFAPGTLISGGGDPVLKLWDWMAGTVKHEIEILSAVESFIKVKVDRTKRRDGGGLKENKRARRKRAKAERARGKGKGKEDAAEKEQEADEDEDDDDVEMAGEGEEIGVTEKEKEAEAATGDAPTGDEPQGKPNDTTPETIFVLHKIATLYSDQRYLIFGAVGNTALFACLYSEEKPSPPICSLDLKKPILDFIVADDGFIWVTIDAEWAEPGTGTESPASKMVHVVKLTSEKFELLDAASEPAILGTLNSECLLPATASELKSLDLYASLESMPKNYDAESNPMEREDVDLPEAEIKPSNNKIQGRLRSKQLLAKKVQNTTSGTPAPEEMGETAATEDGPQPKRSKSERAEGEDAM